MDQSITHIRPRFKFTVPYSESHVMTQLRTMLENAPDNISGKIIDNHIILDIVGEDVHYWSPQLNFRVEQDDENEKQAIVAGLIGPRPAVWTMFVFIYFSLGITGFFVGSYGLAKWYLGNYSHWVLAFPLAFLFMLTAYSAGKYGERLGADQIELLKQFVREALNALR